MMKDEIVFIGLRKIPFKRCKSKRGKGKIVPEKFLLRKATEEDAEELAAVFGEVFEVYPTPLNEASYVKQTMKEDDTIYYVYEFEGKIISTASAEMNIKKEMQN